MTMVNPFEKVVRDSEIIKQVIKLPYHYLFVMYNDKKSDKIKSLDPFMLVKFIEDRRDIVLHYSISNKTVDASQYDELE